MPTEQELEEHNATHLPHRSWCPVCTKARGKEDAHKKAQVKGEKPIVSMDYKTFGENPGEDDKMTMVVMKDEMTGCVAAHVCQTKGATDQWIVDRLCDDIELFGHTEVILESDGEPSMVQVQGAIREKRAHGTICQNSPAYNPQANGAAERAVQEVMGHEDRAAAEDQRRDQDGLEDPGVDRGAVDGADQPMLDREGWPDPV